jgi:hypothetical protein
MQIKSGKIGESKFRCALEIKDQKGVDGWGDNTERGDCQRFSGIILGAFRKNYRFSNEDRL